MYHHILIATDGSERARHALVHALTLGKAVGASVTVLTATEPWTATEMASRAALGDRRPIDDYEREAQVMAQRILDAARDKAAEIGVACDYVHEPDSRPSEAILRVAQARGCDLIVVSSHGREGLSRIFIGSQAGEVIAGAKAPVLVCR